MDRLFYLNHSPVNVYFSKNARDFVVDEVSLYEFSGDGEHLVLKIRKKDTTTWDMLQKLSEVSGCKLRDFGYAGLKDKEGMTMQYISMPKKFEAALEGFDDEKIKIVEKTYHKNKIKIGHLKGNRFFIRLKKVNPVDALKLKNVLQEISKQGMPNYFGYQRFGIEKNNFEIGKEILQGKKIKNPKKRKFFISAYQSHLFNLWLSRRVEISKLFNSFDTQELKNLFDFPKEIIKQIKGQKSFFRILPGDIASHYPYGKVFMCDDIKSEAQRFEKKEISVTGLLPGAKTVKSDGIAGVVEREFYSACEPYMDKMQGSRRYAWIFPSDIDFVYKEDNAWFEFSFFLPKGSYATVFLEELIHKNERLISC